MHFGSAQIQQLFRIKDQPRKNQVHMVWMCQASFILILNFNTELQIYLFPNP